ncbi:unnamed protein product [Trichogramma brassicae]|uniref:Uncharacterized protein n=1 Tax=Trichogramma brassicae TaxID=86971 RepID=A0A6H5J3E1_9HYME|nr:unnamed protein product [Trichogramma brassicae]
MDVSYESFNGVCGGGGQYDSRVMGYFGKRPELEKLKSLSEQIDWEIERERYHLLEKLYPLINYWPGQFPDLREIFQEEQIERLLWDSASYECGDRNSYRGERFIDFVINTGYTDKPCVEKLMSRRTTPVHRVARREHRAYCNRHECTAVVSKLFKIYDRFEVNYADESGLTHLHAACASGCYDVIETFLKLGYDVNCIATETGDTPLHLAASHQKEGVVELLLKNGADPNLTNAKGLTSLHVICRAERDNCNFAKMLLDLGRSVCKPVQVDARDKFGNTALHLAAMKKNTKVVRLLLAYGANPNLADSQGFTLLHSMSSQPMFDGHLVRTLFECSHESHRPVQIDARDRYDLTPLHMAVHSGNLMMTNFLLRSGVDANSVNAMGKTALHVICDKVYDNGLAREFLKTNDDLGRTVLIDVQDKGGNTPLHLALSRNLRGLAQLLLRKGASSNLANDKGLTPLHLICEPKFDCEFVKSFFEINDYNHQLVQIHAQDNLGRTPLQLAVKNLLPDVVDLLLDRGALSSFVFPSEGHFDERFRSAYNIELRVASGAMAVVERLEKKGYELDQSDALTIMSLFAKHRLFEKPKNLDERWYDDERFASKSKWMTIKPGVSLYDLIQLRPEEAARRITYTDYCNFERSEKLRELPGGYIFAMHMCEKMLRRFFRRWAIYPCWELIHHRLPLECCDMIIENLMNEDLWHICLAATGKSS